MSEGMWEQWASASIVVGDHILIIIDNGDGWVKAYDAASNIWQVVEGGGVPRMLKWPYIISSVSGEIYVVGRSGLEVGVGMLMAEAAREKERLRVGWEAVKDSPVFVDLVPYYSKMLYAYISSRLERFFFLVNPNIVEKSFREAHEVGERGGVEEARCGPADRGGDGGNVC